MCFINLLQAMTIFLNNYSAFPSF